MEKRKEVAVIGCGALGRTFVHVLKEKLAADYSLSGIMARNRERGMAFAEAEGCPYYASIEEMIGSRPDFIVEIASGAAVRQYGEAALRAGIDLVVISVGALADYELYQRLMDTASHYGSKLYIASGSIGGFDLMRTIALADTPEVTIESFKSPAGLSGAPHLAGKSLSETDEAVVYSGNARNAIAGFPKNVNVAVAASLATVGVDKARSVIHSVPGIRDTVHKVSAQSTLGAARIEITVKPDPTNPRSSTFAAWSVAALLQNLASPIQYF